MSLEEIKEYCLSLGIEGVEITEINFGSIVPHKEFDAEKNYAEIIRKTPERLSM
jgi:hypothetical protein